jgi:hypothetical protein
VLPRLSLPSPGTACVLLRLASHASLAGNVSGGCHPGLFGYHHYAGTCTETLIIRKSVMSDEHKREAEYHARAAERAGHVADFEVVTAGHTRVDVVVNGRVGFEIQRSALSTAVTATAPRLGA